MRNVFRDKQHKELIDRLTTRGNNDVKLFETIKSLQCFAALIGFHIKKRIPIEKNGAEHIDWGIFDSKGHAEYIFLIALTENNDIQILDDNKESSSTDFIQIFEEYANAGFYKINEWLKNIPDAINDDYHIMIGLEQLLPELLNDKSDSKPLKGFEFKNA